jgi:hypothetical protein
MMLLRLIIIDLSLRPNEISSSLGALLPRHLSATSIHFLSILHTKWASNESYLPKSAMNLKTFKGLWNTLHIPRLSLGDEVLSRGICSLGISLVKFVRKFNDFLRKIQRNSKTSPRNLMILISSMIFLRKS